MANYDSRYTPEIAEDICERLASGESLLAIGKLEGMPTEVTIRRWVQADRDGFAAKYTRAREVAYHRMADEIVEISDLPVIGQKITTKSDGSVETVTGDMVDRAKLRLDARKWMLSKMLPKVYGDNRHLSLTGPNDGPVQVAAVDWDKVPSENLRMVQQAVRLAAEAGGEDGET